MTLTIRPLAMADVDHIMQWINDPEVVGNFAKFTAQTTRAEEEAYVQKMLTSKTDRVYAIDVDGTYIGNIGLHEINWTNKTARLAIIIGRKDYWGKGFAQWAIKGIMKEANALSLHKVWLVVLARNAKARHIYEKCGFQQEGLLKEEYCLGGHYLDMVRMAHIMEGEA
ncbi:GNAT family N-acetyltransferase [Candidatus Woesearchaeota archaeon]|nr:GNAT family N-acetyltransferase [Candidatus Woesearchaeota archaeon]